jgi:hypothetical protein
MLACYFGAALTLGDSAVYNMGSAQYAVIDRNIQNRSQQKMDMFFVNRIPIMR